MDIIEQIKDLLGIKSAPAPSPRVNAVREALETGQRAKRAEDYPRAMEALNRAMRLVEDQHDLMGMSVVALQKAEVLIYQKKWEEAETLLMTIQQRAQNSNQRGHTAYTFTALGTLAQAQGDWATARQQYEQALHVARTVGALGAEGRALGHLADTYLQQENASYAAHLLREALPKINITGEVEWSSYFVGLLGQALIQTGQEVEGTQLLNRALRLAKQLNDRRNERYWALALAERALIDSRFQDAFPYYEQALRLFDAPVASRIYITALCQMSKVCWNLSRHDEALRYATEAEILNRELNDPELQTIVQGTIGMALHTSGQHAKAIAYLEAAAAGYQQLDTADIHHLQIEIVRSLAAAQADSGNDETAIVTYQRAAERAEALGARLELAQARRDLGLLYARRKQMHPAIQEWAAAMAIYEALKAHAQVARLHSDIASARKSLGQGQRAIKEYEQALMALNMVNEDWETRGLVLSNAANAYVDQGDIESAEAFFNEAISLAQRTGNEAAEATRRGNYGWFLISIGRPRQALLSLEHALRLSQMLKLDLQSAIQTDNLGLAYDSMGDHAKASDHHQRALEMIEPLSNSYWQTAFKINQASTLLSLNQVEAAFALFEDAEAQSRADANNEGIIRALTGLARAHLEQHQPEKAEALLSEAIGLARKSDMRRLLAEALSVYSQQQAALNQHERSQVLWDEASKLYNILQAPQGKMQPAWLPEIATN
jgi:tetratricopeptide (TPR) repeat protein